MKRIKQIFTNVTFCLVVGLIIRLIVSFLFYKIHNNDVDAFSIVGNATLSAINSHTTPTTSLPYFPLLIYLNALSVFLMHQFGINNILLTKIFFSFFDVGIVYLIYLLDHKKTINSWLYAINPISIMITCIHGQFDAIPLFFLLLAIYFWKAKQNNPFYLFSSMGIGIKTWPLLFLIPILKQTKNRIQWLMLGIVPLLLIIIYVFLFKSDSIIRTVLIFRGLFGWYGIGYFVSFFTNRRIIYDVLSSLFLVNFVLFSLFQKEKDVMKAILNQMFFFFIFTVSFGIQWLMWPVPFILLTRPKFTRLYLISVSILLISIYSQWMGLYSIKEYIFQVMTVIIWLLFIAMAIIRTNNVNLQFLPDTQRPRGGS